MIINKAVYEQLERFNIEQNAGTLYLLSIFYNVDATGIIDDEIIKQVNFSKIVERNYSTRKTTWNIPLFSDERTTIDMKWDWVIDEYRKLWMDIKGSKGGDRATCIAKMKKFFAANPDIRKADVMEAAKQYTSGFIKGNNPTYMVEADNFIFKKVEGTTRSKLDQMLEIVKLSKGSESNRYTDKIR